MSPGARAGFHDAKRIKALPGGQGPEWRNAVRNHVTLSDLIRMDEKELLAIPTDQLFLLTGELDELKARLESAQYRVRRIFDLKYGDTAEGERVGDHGRVRIPDGDFVIISDVRKDVKYDQKGLRSVLKKLKEEGEDIRDYVDVTYKVPEKKYQAWPRGVRAIFDGCRQERASSPTWKMEQAR